MPFEVPPLPYEYNALEPHIDERTMQIHHDKHHQAYVDNANKALDGTEWADKPVEEVLRNLDKLPEDKRAAGAEQRRRPCQPLAVLDRHGPGRRRRAVRRARRGDRAALSAASTPSRRSSPRPASTRFGSVGRWLVVERRQAGGHVDAEPGQPDLGRQDADPRHRRLGARLLPELPEPPARLRRRPG